MKHAPGVPKVLVGNRLHLAFKRQVAAKQAELYASRNKMACFEISPLCDFNIRESFCELARMALHRNGMERIWRSNKGIPNSFIHSFNQTILMVFINSNSFLHFSLQYFHFKSYAVGRLCVEHQCMQSISCHYHHRLNHISNHMHSHHHNASIL